MKKKLTKPKKTNNSSKETPIFIPSIAAVETAIPAFIGYTEKAQEFKVDDLLNRPKKISSLSEYVKFFGSAAKPKVTSITLDESNNFKSATFVNQFFLFDSLRLFYSNGGRDCYIVSVATYDTAIFSSSEFTDDGKGIKAIEKINEPTILVFPDNSLLKIENHFYNVYTEALQQCGKLGDRICVFDLKVDDSLGSEFREKIGLNHLSYGAAYSPWLLVNFPKSINYRDFKDIIFKNSDATSLIELTSDPDIKREILEFELVIADCDIVRAANSSLNGSYSSFKKRYSELEQIFKSSKTALNIGSIVNLLFDIARQLDTLIGEGTLSLKSPNLKTQTVEQVVSVWKPLFTLLIGFDKELSVKIEGYFSRFDKTILPTSVNWGGIFENDTSPPSSSIINLSNSYPVEARLDQMLPVLSSLFELINTIWISSIFTTLPKLETDKHNVLFQFSSIYKTIITGIQNTNTSIPPCGAVVGVYAFVDNTRGVWKAPANVSLSNVIRPHDNFTTSQLADLNVDINAGKSINAIRLFSGKGTLIFGARTLAGNDNEWRYISVRRLYNMVEVSTKKATEQFVFEPNDANTWVKVQGMIENFLFSLWRVGALQGAKPEHAFYVAVGLGKTMTPLDILEGRMIIELGLAVVRPAEFTILRFSHKMEGT